MRKPRRIRAEMVIAIMLAVSLCMLIAIPFIGYMFARPPVATGDTPEERAESRAEIKAIESGADVVVRSLLVGGIAGAVISIASGLVIAFGIGPSWMASRHEGMVVQDKFGDDGRNKYFGNSVPTTPGLRYYVRVRRADGRIAEFHTDRETYTTIAPGQVLTAHVLGRRLIKIERTDN